MKNQNNLTEDCKFLITIALRDANKGTEIINDIPTRRFEKDAEWIASDTLEIYTEDLHDEICFRLDQSDIEYESIIIEILN